MIHNHKSRNWIIWNAGYSLKVQFYFPVFSLPAWIYQLVAKVLNLSSISLDKMKDHYYCNNISPGCKEVCFSDFQELLILVRTILTRAPPTDGSLECYPFSSLSKYWAWISQLNIGDFGLLKWLLSQPQLSFSPFTPGKAKLVLEKSWNNKVLWVVSWKAI